MSSFPQEKEQRKFFTGKERDGCRRGQAKDHLGG